MVENIEISKIHIATSQLNTSIQLYIDNKDLISALTLAGAAEEILGNLLKNGSKANALEAMTNRLCEMHKLAFGEDPNKKSYIDLKNKTKNEFKHLRSGNALTINLDRETSQLINRAIDNYKKLFTNLSPELYTKFKEFEVEWLKRN
jgi:hypothetical protein